MIRFFSKDIKFNLPGKPGYKKWIKSVIQQYGFRVGDVNVVFCDDPYILEINNSFLGHDYFTDIITFDYSEGEVLNGELYISIDTVKANAQEYSQNFPDELNRVIIHGFLHLCGFDDHSDEDILKMRAAENSALSVLSDFTSSK